MSDIEIRELKCDIETLKCQVGQLFCKHENKRIYNHCGRGIMYSLVCKDCHLTLEDNISKERQIEIKLNKFDERVKKARKKIETS